MLSLYLQRLQRILGDQTVERFNPFDLVEYINEARTFTAIQGECVRVLCPSTAGVASVLVTAGGSGYTLPPTVTITSPNVGTTATATTIIRAGAVIAVNLVNPGSGYTSPTMPGISFAGGGGTGAAATVNLMPFAQTVAGQEVYPFSMFNPLIAGAGQGAAEIISINTVAVSWGSMKPMLRRMTWGDFQAYLRSYNVGVQGYSRVWAPYARGSGGSFYIWPIPSQASQMDLDCICTPADLIMGLNDNQQVEAIPSPWTKAVPYKAAELAVMGEPDLRELADRYARHWEARMLFASATTGSQALVPDFYDPSSRL